MSSAEGRRRDHLSRAANELSPSAIWTYELAERFAVELFNRLNECVSSETVQVLNTLFEHLLRKDKNGRGGGLRTRAHR